MSRSDCLPSPITPGTPSGEPTTLPITEALESLAEHWLEASGTSLDDEQAPAKFFEQAAEWVLQGILLVIPPASPGFGVGETSEVAPA